MERVQMAKFAESLFCEVFDSDQSGLSFLRDITVNVGTDTYQPEWVPELVEYFLQHQQSEECIPSNLQCIVEMLEVTSKFAYTEGYFAGKED